jgi:hypothetical protein
VRTRLKGSTVVLLALGLLASGVGAALLLAPTEVTWALPGVAADAAVAPPVIWKTIAPGAERGFASGDDLGLELFRFDLERFGAEVVVAGERRPAHARIWLAGPRHNAAELLRGFSGAVVAVVNGGFFDDRGRSLGLRITHGDVAISLRRNVDWGVFYVAARRARIVHSREFVAAPGIEAAIQVGPRILIDGVVPRLKPQTARRTAIALDREGRTLTLVVSGEPVEATALGSRLAALGFHSALLLDGGPSTQLSAQIAASPDAGSAIGATADGATRVEIPGAYPVPDLLAIVRR